ncbi:MAG: 4Fe-4S dicluster domain-containing protein, partial [Melioribacteraceae bacterium]|nr:4Fe-4S dicluster domain-containing protein [Melioribacteraceae bacterium]
EFTTDPKEYSQLWNVRKGLFPSVSKSRKAGTTVVIEDVNFETAKLAEAVLDLQSLFLKHNYPETIIWGHALSGNIHFVFSQNFNEPKEVERYKNFMDDVVELVIEKYDGSLKAEHGTGRNMAPFVKYEWGEEAYSLMLQIKNLFDPKKILNPGVLINEDEQVHIKNLKPTPIVNPIIDKCIDCGFCEDVCPSKNLTLTPRQRITVWREIDKLKVNNEDYSRLEELEKRFNYYGEQTCATDGLCELACPVDIDTGKLIKEIRSEQISDSELSFAKWISKNFQFVTTVAKYGLNFVNLFHSLLGDSIMGTITKGTRSLSGSIIPSWNIEMPNGSGFNPLELEKDKTKDTVVYFPSCISRTMGNSKKSSVTENQTDVIQRLLVKANFNIVYPKSINSLCCGMPFSSKGFTDLANYKSKELFTELLEVSENGEIPILFDTSPCTKTMNEYLSKTEQNQLLIYDTVDFIHDILLSKLKIVKMEKTVAIHPTCSTTKMGQTEKIIEIAKVCVTDVHVPENNNCCGFAGDRGLIIPQLTKHAERYNKEQLSLEQLKLKGYSSSRMCEIGMSDSEQTYTSIALLVRE